MVGAFCSGVSGDIQVDLSGSFTTYLPYKKKSPNAKLYSFACSASVDSSKGKRSEPSVAECDFRS